MEKYGLNIHTAASMESPGGRASPHIPLRKISEICRVVAAVFSLSGKCIWVELLRSSLVWTGKRRKIFRTWQTKNSRKIAEYLTRVSRDMEQNGNTRRKDCASCVKMGNRRRIPKLLPEQQELSRLQRAETG